MEKLDIIESNELVSLNNGGNTGSIRTNAIAQYYANSQSVSEKLERSENINQVMDIAMRQIAKTIDNLSGNQQMLLNQDRLEDSTVVSVKKTQVLQRFVNVASKKQAILNNGKNVDLNSPVFKIFQQIVAEKLLQVLQKYGTDPDLIKLIMKTWASELRDWDKQLKERIKSLGN